MKVKLKDSFQIVHWDDTELNRKRLKAWDLEIFDGQTETGYDGNEYVKGHSPLPELTLEQQVVVLESKYQMARWQREGILASPGSYSPSTVQKAQEIETLAIGLRKGNNARQTEVQQ